MILIVSYMSDWHSRAVRWALEEAGVRCQEIDTYFVPSSCRATLDVNAGPGPAFSWNAGTSACTVDLSDISVAWMRRLNDSEFDLSRVNRLDRETVVRECGAFFRNLYALIQHAGGHCINDENLSRRIDNKAIQLRMAEEAGLAVPSTIVSNDPSRILEFSRRHGGELIMKPFFQELWDDDQGRAIQYANVVSSRLIEDHAEAISLCPNIFQERVPKSHELRIVVMGEKIVAARVDSQSSEDTSIDWRNDAAACALALEPRLPDAVREQILRFMRLAGIEFGSIDMVVTPDGRHVFLELNEQGQFLWMEKRNPAIALLRPFAAFLAERAGVPADLSGISLSAYRASTTYQLDCASYSAAKEAYLRQEARA